MADAFAAASTAAARHRALARADAGKSLSLEEVTALLEVEGDELTELCAIAARLRELGWSDTVTYSRKVFVPLTMLCRDHCHYCTFAKPPAKLDAPFLTPEEVVAVAAAGARAGCKEALFTLGDRPEERYDQAASWLRERGYVSTLDYVRAAAIQVIEQTGLLPHLNPGVMSYEELARLKANSNSTSATPPRPAAVAEVKPDSSASSSANAAAPAQRPAVSTMPADRSVQIQWPDSGRAPVPASQNAPAPARPNAAEIIPQRSGASGPGGASNRTVVIQWPNNNGAPPSTNQPSAPSSAPNPPARAVQQPVSGAPGRSDRTVIIQWPDSKQSPPPRN